MVSRRRLECPELHHGFVSA